MGWKVFYRSIQVPGILAPTLRTPNPLFSNTVIYQGLRPAERRRTLPPVFKARCSACTWVKACEPSGQNQSMLSMICFRWVSIGGGCRLFLGYFNLTTAWLRVPGAIRQITSWSSSVWIRSPSNAPGWESLRCALFDRYCGWHLTGRKQDLGTYYLQR